jgi:hypothetical protein
MLLILARIGACGARTIEKVPADAIVLDARTRRGAVTAAAKKEIRRSRRRDGSRRRRRVHGNARSGAYGARTIEKVPADTIVLDARTRRSAVTAAAKGSRRSRRRDWSRRRRRILGNARSGACGAGTIKKVPADTIVLDARTKRGAVTAAAKGSRRSRRRDGSRSRRRVHGNARPSEVALTIDSG